jgi:AcrR family transcriptional regulator
MPRVRPEHRLDHLVETAAKVFTARGYRRTQMADVARAMGVAPGTLYLYVASKEALFDLVVQRAFRDADTLPPPRLPIPAPAAGATLHHLRERFAREARLQALAAALSRRRVSDARAELEGIVRELYAFVAAKRRGIALLDRSALDWPELATLFFKGFRRTLLRQLTTYLERRMRQRQLRRVPHPAAAARLIVETVAWFAMHRHGDLDSSMIDDAAAEATVVDALVNTFAKE